MYLFVGGAIMFMCGLALGLRIKMDKKHDDDAKNRNDDRQQDHPTS